MDMTNSQILSNSMPAQALLLLHQVDCSGAIHIVCLGFEVMKHLQS